MLGRKAENTYYISALTMCLDKRVAQMQKFKVIDFSKVKSHKLFDSYSQNITALQTTFQKINVGKGAELTEFSSAYSRLYEAAVILKKYQQSMMLYRYLSLKEFNQFYDHTQAIEDHMAGVLSAEQKQIIAANKTFLAGESFFDVLQARKAIQSFDLYLKTQLQFEVERFDKPFMHRLWVVLLDPSNLWSKTGWRLLMSNGEGKEALIGSVMALKKICDEALSLNALQFYFLSQTPHDKKALSLRERDAIKALLLDPSIQKSLIAKRLLDQEELICIEANWEGFFKKLYEGKQTREPIIRTLNVAAKPPLKAASYISANEMLDKLAAIEDPEAAYKHFGMPGSLLETFIQLSKPNKWGRQLCRDKKTLVHYDEAMMQIQDLLQAFSTQKMSSSLAEKEYFALLGFIDKFTLLYQNHEQALSKDKVGKKFLFFISCLIELLSNFQINSTTFYNSVKENEVTHLTQASIL